MIQKKYSEAGSISRAALIGLSSAVNRGMINRLSLDSTLRIKDKEGRIVPLILVIDDARGVVCGADQRWLVPGLSEKFDVHADAIQAYYKYCQEGYQDRGWGCGGQSFAVTVRNIPDAPVVYLASTRGDLNASIDTSTVTFGFLPTPNEGDGCGYFLSDAFYLSLMPEVSCEQGSKWPEDFVKALRPVFDEMSDTDQAWQLMSVLNESADDNDKLTCPRFEAIFGLPNSEKGRLTSAMLKRQLSLMKGMSEILSSPEKTVFYERLKAELPGHEDIVDLFSEYILRKSAVASIEDNIFSVYAGRARTLCAGAFVAEPWWEYFTVSVLERVLTMSETVASSFRVIAKDPVVGSFSDRKQPLVGRNSMQFSFAMENPDALVSVLRGKKVLEDDLPLTETYEYLHYHPIGKI